MTNLKELLYDKMCEISNEQNMVSIQKKDLAELIGTYPANPKLTIALEELENENKIKLIQKASHSGHKHWSNWIWEIIRNKKITNKIDVNDFIVDKFEDIEFKLYKTDSGYAMSVADIARSLHVDRQTIHDLIERNYDLFVNWLVSITLTRSNNATTNLCLLRDGILGIVMKISINRLSEDKKELVLKFQKWAIEKLGKLISEGKVELDDQEQIKVQSQMAEITNLNESQMDLLFNQFEEEFTKFLESTKIMVKSAEEKRNLAERKATDLEYQNQKWISKTQSMINKMHSYNVL
jgi:predicted DNA-binding protein YlxM (UPF0122 family)